MSVQGSVEITAPQRNITVEITGPIEVTHVDVTTTAPEVEVVESYITGAPGPQGPAGPPGSPGPKGDPGETDYYDDLPDLVLIYENGLI